MSGVVATSQLRFALLLTALSTLGACASAQGHGTSPPARQTLEAAPLAPQTRALPSGLKVVTLPAPDGVFTAGLLIGGGPLDDPADLPGLTELAVQAAMLGTSGDPDGQRPVQRALAAGGALHTVVDGRVFGWLVRAPSAATRPLLQLLHDLGTAPTLPASRFEILLAMAREQVATEGLGGTGTGIAVAIGTALGLGRAVPLGPTRETLERVNREDVLRQFKRAVRPDRAVLIVQAPPGFKLPADILEAFAAWAPAALPSDAAQPEIRQPCLPLGQTLHRIATDDAAKTRSIALVAAAAPGVGDPERDALESLTVWLAERPGGPIERVVGPDEALRAHPWVLDLGWGGGRGVAVLLSAAGGDNDQAAKNLRALSQLLADQAATTVLSPEQAADAHRAVAGQSRLALAAPLTGLIALGTRALYSVRDTAPDAESIHAMAARWLAPHRQSLVVVGFADLSTDADERVHESVWDDAGRLARDEAPIRCVPLDVLRRQMPVDSAAPPR